MTTAPTLLVSWSHSEPGWSEGQIRQRRDAVLRLTNNLRARGIDALLDLHQPGGTADWNRWGPDKVASSDFILIVGSRAWNQAWQGNGDPTRGAGAAAEADALKTLYNHDRRAFLAKVRLVFLPGTPTERPLGLDGIERYELADETPEALSGLIRDLSNQPAFPPGPLGQLPDLPPDNSWLTGSKTPSPTSRPVSQPTPTHPPTQPSEGDLNYRDLTESITVQWRSEWPDRDHHRSSRSLIAVHVLPEHAAPLSARRLSALSDSIVRQVRKSGLFDDADALNKVDDAQNVQVSTPLDDRYLNRVVLPARLQGVRINRSGQVSAWHTLPADQNGSALERQSAAGAIEGALLLVGATEAMQSEDVAVAVEVSPISMLDTVDPSTLGTRRGAAIQSFGPSEVRVEPDELVDIRALSERAGEASQTLAALLLRAWGQRR